MGIELSSCTSRNQSFLKWQAIFTTLLTHSYKTCNCLQLWSCDDFLLYLTPLNRALTKVDKSKYLGSVLTPDADVDKDLDHRINTA